MVGGNLPLELTTFIGRAAELERIPRWLEARRLVTVTGPGGIGKTRLALRAASITQSRYRDGVCFTDLSSAISADQVGALVGHALGISVPDDDTFNALVRSLEAKRLLIVLDSCESVLVAVADLARALLGACPDLHILMTSREVTGMDRDVVCTAPPLSLPNGCDCSVEQLQCSEAACLFVHRLRDGWFEFEMTPRTTLQIAEICHNLDGNPLALELAAGWVRDFGLVEVLSLTRDHGRLLNLSSADHRRPSRQRTIKASLDWSFDRVPDAERMLLGRLAVLEGSWTLRDAQRVGAAAGFDVAAVPDVLGKLIARSLIGVERSDESICYRLSGTLRQYARDHCAASDLPRGLTSRERQVLSLLARGYSNKEIGTALKISYGTARIHVEHILTKLNVRSRTQAALWAVQRAGLPTGFRRGQSGLDA